MLLAISSVASGFIYDNLVLNVGQMTGGLFTNLFVMSVMEAPANYLAVIFAVRMGPFIRNYTHNTNNQVPGLNPCLKFLQYESFCI